MIMSKARCQMGLIMDQFICHCRTVEVDPVNYKLHTQQWDVLVLRLYSFTKLYDDFFSGEGGLALSPGSSQLFNVVFLRVTLKKMR